MNENPEVKAWIVVAVLTIMAMCTSASPSFAQGRRFEFQPKLREWDTPKAENNRKIDFLYKASHVYLAVGTAVDMVSTVRVLNHPTWARKENGSFLARSYGVETGWARVFGKRNTGAVVAANVGLTVGVHLLSRKLYRKGGRWRILAISLNVLKGTNNLIAGVRNIRYYDSGFDQRMREATGYQGTIIWSSQ